MEKKVYIIIVNWNSAEHTIECLKSISKLTYSNFQIIIVDNNSDKLFVNQIKNYIASDKFYRHSYSISEYDINSNSNSIDRYKLIDNRPIIIECNINHGFGIGNNIGFSFAKIMNDYEFIWLLNNDVVVDLNSLTEMVSVAKSNSSLGFIGSTIAYYYDRNIIQAVGGASFYSFIGASKLVGKGLQITEASKIYNKNKHKINYLMGASILIRKECLNDIDGFDNSFFLYCEEIDLQKRGLDKGWKLDVAIDCFIYHKESASTQKKSNLYFYHFTKSSVILARKHYGILKIIATCIFILINSISKVNNLNNFSYVLKGLRDGFYKN